MPYCPYGLARFLKFLLYLLRLSSILYFQHYKKAVLAKFWPAKFEGAWHLY
jgi:hypothetical protein